MADFVLKISPQVVLGSYSCARIGHYAAEWGTRYMVVMDPSLKEFDIYKKVQTALSDKNIDFFIFDDIPPAPDTTVIERALKLARDAHIHGILAVGGVKTANIARATAALYYEVHSVYDFLDGSKFSTSALPLIVVSTTMRDALLFTDKLLITDGRNRQLKNLQTQSNLCKTVIFDPNVTISLTETQKASFLLQTLCLAIEGYVSQKANFFSNTLIEQAVSMLGENLNALIGIDGTVFSDQTFAQAGYLTSLGVGVSSLGPASLLALTINARYKIDRSIVTCILMPYFIEEVVKYKSDKLIKIADLLHFSLNDKDFESLSYVLGDFIRNKIAMVKLPTRLKDLSLSIEQLALCVEDAANLDYMSGLPRSMSSDDLFELIKQAY